MKTKRWQVWTVALLACLLVLCTAMSAFADSGTTGGTQSGNTSAPSTGDGTTDVLAGVTVDYMFPLRYVVTNTGGQPIAGASIEHFDTSVNDYVFVGRTDADGRWQTKVTPDFWMNGVMQQTGQAGVVYYENNAFNIHHRVSAEGYITKEETAGATLETIDGETVGVVYVVLERKPGQATDTDQSHTSMQPTGTKTGKPTPTGGLLPKTGVQSYWMPLAAGSLLLLLAALLLARLLHEEKKNDDKTDGRNTNT